MENRSLFWKVGITTVFAVAMALYWYFARPMIIEHLYSISHSGALGSQLSACLMSVGGLVAYIGSFLQSLCTTPAIGALVMSVVLAIPLQMLVWNEMEAKTDALFLQSFISSVLLLWLTGDQDVLPAYPVALIIALIVSAIIDRKLIYADIIIIPVLYWLLGAAAWVYVLVRIVHCGWRTTWWMAAYMLIVQVVIWFACQSMSPAPTGFAAYHNDPSCVPALTVIIPIVIMLMVIPVKSMTDKDASYKGAMIAQLVFLLIITAMAVAFS